MTQLSRKLRFAYMDHWRIDGPQGYVSPYASVKLLDGFVKQIAALGFEGLETFDFHLGVLTEMFGSLLNAREFLQERGIDRIAHDAARRPPTHSSTSGGVRTLCERGRR